jgi:hypothetical protein
MIDSVYSTHLPSLGHSIWLQKYNTVFVYLPKVACTSWKLFLARALRLPLPSPLPLGSVHHRDIVRLPYVSSLEASEQDRFQQELKAGQIQLMAVVREPRERVLSAYLDKVWLHQNSLSYFSQVVLPDLQEYLGLSPSDRPTFLQFLRWLESRKSASCSNDHWLPQSQLLGEVDILPNVKLWPMEHMHQAVAALQHVFGEDLPFPGREELAPRESSGSSDHLLQAFTPEVDDCFRKIYTRDLNLHQHLLMS